MGHFESYRETSELAWQYNLSRKAMQHMNLIAENASLEESRKTMLKEISLFIFVSRKLAKEQRYPNSKKYQEILERYQSFLYHLYGEICGYHRRRL